jgi:hypothetical protein
MKFFSPKVANLMTSINQSLVVDVGETNGPNPIITHNGAKVLECLRGDNIWQIEHCPPKSSNRCSVLQKNTKHYCKAKIISKQIDHMVF